MRRSRKYGILSVLAMTLFLSSWLSSALTAGNGQSLSATLESPLDNEFTDNALTLYAVNREGSLTLGSYYFPLYMREQAGRLFITYSDYRLEIYPTSNGLEFDVIIDTNPGPGAVYAFPLTLRDLEAYYQPPLNEEILEKGWTVNATHAIDENGTLSAYRPIEKVGSWAFYLQGKRGNQYTTGKAFHLDAPYVYDASGLVNGYGEISIENGELRIRVPDFIFQFGTYPLTIDPAFGKTDVGGSDYNMAADYCISMRTSNPEAGPVNVESITAYVKSSQSGTRQAKVALYNHDAGNDRAGDLLDDSDEENFVFGQDNWRVFDGSSYSGLDSGTCWLSILVDDILTVKYDSVGSTNWRSKNDFTYPTFGDPWGPPDWSTSREISIYANYSFGVLNPPVFHQVEIDGIINASVTLNPDAWSSITAYVNEGNFTVSQLELAFMDGTTWFNCTWNMTGFYRIDGYLAGELDNATSANQTVGISVRVTFRVRIKYVLDDAYSQPVYVRATDTGGNSTHWQTAVTTVNLVKTYGAAASSNWVIGVVFSFIALAVAIALSPRR